MRELEVGGARIDAGPTVFTMRQVFDEIFASAGASFADRVSVRRAEVLARHAWSGQERLDLYADVDRSADAIGTLRGCGGSAAVSSVQRTGARRVSDAGTTLHPLPAGRPRRLGPKRRLERLGRTAQHPAIHLPLARRRAAVSGSATAAAVRTVCDVLRFVAISGAGHADADRACRARRCVAGRWRHASHRAGAGAARNAPRCDAFAIALRWPRSSSAAAARSACGSPQGNGSTRTPSCAMPMRPPSPAGTSGRAASAAVPAASHSQRSLSAVAWTLLAESDGWPLLRHNVFFSDDYAAEFEDIFQRRRLPEAPTVYVCAQDRSDREDARPRGPERLLCLVNAPPTGDSHSFDSAEIAKCEERSFSLLRRCGIDVRPHPERMRVTTPADFARLFPGSGGALYGMASHGWTASFRRPRVSQPDSRAVPGGRQHASGPGRTDGSTVGLLCGQRADGGPRFDRAVPAGGYAWWYVDALEQRRSTRTHPDRVHRQRLLALLRARAPPCATASPNHCSSARSTSRSTATASAGRSPSAVRGPCGAHRRHSRSGRIRSTGTATRSPSTSTSEARHSPRPFRARCASVRTRCRTIRSCSTVKVATAGHRSRRARGSTSIFAAPRLRWSGAGYLDSNAGDAPLEDAFRGWTWSRARTRTGTTVLYDVVQRSGAALSLALEFGASGNVRTLEVPREMQLPRNALAHPSLRSGPMPAIDPASSRRSRTRPFMRARSSRRACTANASPRCTRAFRSIASAPDGCACSCPSGCGGNDDRLRRASRAPCPAQYR